MTLFWESSVLLKLVDLMAERGNHRSHKQGDLNVLLGGIDLLFQAAEFLNHYACICEQEMCGGQRTTLGVGPYLCLV